MFRVLTIAGSDSGGGAGIEADVKTISALGVYACTTITALTAQNTLGVKGVHAVPADFVRLSIETVLADIGADAIKLGMLTNADIIRAVAGTLPGNIPLVLDPVMVATSGAVLLPAKRSRRSPPCCSRAPPSSPPTCRKRRNSPPCRRHRAERIAAGRALIALAAGAALIKGGHGEGGPAAGELVTDYLVTQRGSRISRSRACHPQHPRHRLHPGLAIATGLAQDMTLLDAVHRARAYLHHAIHHAPGFGAGNGPVNHLVAPPRL